MIHVKRHPELYETDFRTTLLVGFIIAMIVVVCMVAGLGTLFFICKSLLS